MYILQKAEGTTCAICTNKVNLLCDDEWRKGRAAFYICFHCHKVAVVGVGAVTRYTDSDSRNPGFVVPIVKSVLTAFFTWKPGKGGHWKFRAFVTKSDESRVHRSRMKRHKQNLKLFVRVYELDFMGLKQAEVNMKFQEMFDTGLIPTPKVEMPHARTHIPV